MRGNLTTDARFQDESTASYYRRSAQARPLCSYSPNDAAIQRTQLKLRSLVVSNGESTARLRTSNRRPRPDAWMGAQNEVKHQYEEKRLHMYERKARRKAVTIQYLPRFHRNESNCQDLTCSTFPLYFCRWIGNIFSLHGPKLRNW